MLLRIFRLAFQGSLYFRLRRKNWLVIALGLLIDIAARCTSVLFL